ncbi:MAG TPA: GNAT family N-acetyltransferase [Flavisolibacter sp.]|nr:GNAT family N-acetyltransferase [Flavisolibacter sp.]
MEEVLNNPVYHALCSGDTNLGFGEGQVKCFLEAVSPFAGFPDEYDNGFDDLFDFLPEGRKILYATRRLIKEPPGWQLAHEVKGLQFVFGGSKYNGDAHPVQLVPLNTTHVDEMVQLASLTKPGPFNSRTIEFGYYYGIFQNNRLVAMAGQRLHPSNYTEISAVCTHPDYLGRGYAAALIGHQLNLISEQGQIAFLHVRADNERAIALYERLGFTSNGPMNFYFLQRKSSR